MSVSDSAPAQVMLSFYVVILYLVNPFTASFADFVIVASLQFFRVSKESIYKRAVAEVPELSTLYEARSEWTKRDM